MVLFVATHTNQEMGGIPTLRDFSAHYILDQLLYRLSSYESKDLIRIYKPQKTYAISRNENNRFTNIGNVFDYNINFDEICGVTALDPMDIKKISYSGPLSPKLCFIFTCTIFSDYIYPMLAEKTKEISHDAKGLLLSVILRLKSQSIFAGPEKDRDRDRDTFVHPVVHRHNDICGILSVLYVDKRDVILIDPFRLISLLFLFINHVTHVTLRSCLDSVFSRDKFNVLCIFELLGRMKNMILLDVSYNPVSVDINSLSLLWNHQDKTESGNNLCLPHLKSLVLMNCPKIHIRSLSFIDFSSFYSLFLHIPSLQEVVVSPNQVAFDVIKHRTISIISEEKLQEIDAMYELGYFDLKAFFRDLVKAYLYRSDPSFYHMCDLDEVTNYQVNHAIAISRIYHESIACKQSDKRISQWTRHKRKNSSSHS